MNRETFVDYVTKYATLFWTVYPVQPVSDGCCTCSKGKACPDPGKHPHFALGGLAKATSNVARASDMFAESDAQVGLVCGSDFWVLDVDGPQGLDDLSKLTSENGELPLTPTVETGGGGRHIYFKSDARVRCRTKIGGISIDVKAKGGMVVAPPSSHHSGGVYKWIIEPENARLAEAPGWLIDFVTSKQTVTATTLPVFVVDDTDLRTAPGVGEGQRNDRLCRLIGTELARHGQKPDLLQAAIAWGEKCDPPLPAHEVTKVVGNLCARHLKDRAAGGAGGHVGAQQQTHSHKLNSQCFAEIEGKPVVWLWEGRFPIGKLTLLTGDGGVGKSILTCDLASHVSTGRDFPDGSTCPVGDVLLVGSEDGAEDTIRPRLDAAGADVSRVHLIRGPVPAGRDYALPVELSKHLELLDTLLKEKPSTKLIVIDPILDYLGEGINSDKATDIRSILSPLRELAERHQIAIILINHLTKSMGRSKCRSLGSGAFVHVCRVELRVVEDPETPDRRLLLPVKNNLASAAGLAYRIESTANGAGVAIWEEGPVTVTIEEIEAEDGGEARGALSEALAWLTAQLAQGRALSKAITSAAKDDGISHSTLKRAKARMKVFAFQEDRKWWWSLTPRDADGTVENPLPELPPSPVDDEGHPGEGLLF